MRWLGLDVGTRTIGIALSDPLGWTAQPVETLRRARKEADDLQYLARLCRAGAVTGVVVGLPLDQHGQVGRQARLVQRFIEALEGVLDVPIHTWDERLSTRAVERVLLQADVSRAKRRKVVDKLAASYILQGFLDNESRKDAPETPWTPEEEAGSPGPEDPS